MFIVGWSCGSCDDHGCAHTNMDICGVYYKKEVAECALETCFKEQVEAITKDLDPDGEFPDLVENAEIETDGSVEDWCFEIRYTIGTEPVVVRLVIVEVEE